MKNLHLETTKRSNWRFVIILPLLIITLSALAKLLQASFMVKEMESFGISHLIYPLGLLKIFLVIIFMIPRTRSIGFLLLTAYVGGIIATELIMKEPPVPGIIIMILLWLGWYFEKPSWFGFQ